MRELTARIRTHPGAVTALALAAICGVALFLRVYYPFDNVFVDDWVRFQGTDPWYHIRHIENLVHNFPHQTSFDPYGFYLRGSSVGTAPLFDFQMGLFAWVLGVGSPSKALVETVGAYYPAIIGAFVPIPVYFIGNALFGRVAGLLAAALIAVLPGQFLARTLLGYTDHHAAEILFSTLTMLFLILATKNAVRRNVSFASVRGRDWVSLRRPLLYSLLAGISLGMYLLSWASGVFLVFIILVFILLQYVIDHLRGRPTDYLCQTGFPAFLVALVIVVPFSSGYRHGDMQLLSLVIGALGILALSSVSSLMARRNVGRSYFILATAALVGIGVALVQVIDPGMLDAVVERMGVAFNPTGAESLTIAEVGGLSLSLAWEYFGPTFFISLISLAMILYLVIRKGAPDMTLFFVWSLIVLAAAFGQQRFAYYLAVNVALLSAYLCWRVIQVALLWGSRRMPAGREAASGAALPERGADSKLTRKARRRSQRAAAKTGQAPATGRLLNPRTLSFAAALILIFLLVFLPNIRNAVVWADAPRGPHPDWHEALVWMKDNTPEPFSDSVPYYGIYDKPTGRQSRQALRPDYGVMSWWDYGYWITYIAHRVPNANPGGQRGVTDAALFLTAQDESTATEILDAVDSKYVVIDLTTAIPNVDPESGVYSYFASIAEWSGRDSSDFFEEYYGWDEGQFVRLMCYYPAYYQTMCIRLYVFEGQAVIPQNSTWVISFAERTGLGGVKYKEILTKQLFATYEEAEDYVQEHGPANQRIVSNSPHASPVPLEKLEHFHLAYESSTRATTPAAQDIRWVEIFEYVP